MLVAFTVENFRSYRDREELNLLASPIKDLANNFVVVKDHHCLPSRRILKSAAIYGANASGKSNFVNAFQQLRLLLVPGCARFVVGGGPDYESGKIARFLLDSSMSSKPTRFSIVLLLSDTIYEYSVSFSDTGISKELRRNSDTRLESSSDDADFTAIHEWLAKRVQFLSPAGFITPHRREWVNDQLFLDWLRVALIHADIGILDLDVKPNPMNGFGGLFPPIVRALHRGKRARETVDWDFSEESDGTQRFFSLLFSWYEMIRTGGLLIIDELDASLHPLLCRKLVEMVHDPLQNPSGGQLIFTTHDTTLLDSNLFRRDQIYFAEKDKTGASHLYSLLEYAPRKDESLQKGYLAGRYGAIPYLGDLSFETQEGKS